METREKKPFKLDKIISKIIIGLSITGILALITFAALSVFFLSPVDESSNKEIEFVVEKGTSKIDIADNLVKENLIRNAFFFKVYMKINEKEVYAGTYRLSKSMSLDEIINIFNSGKTVENETITVTFIEGRRLSSYIDKISETFDIPKEEIEDVLSDKDYLESLIDKYWFITSDILNKDIYYPLEGYLFPDTYIFRKNANLDEIINKMLDNMNKKLEVYKSEIELSPLSIHEIITLASIIELEGANPLDRAKVAGVFYNRLKKGMTLGSDVTTYYAFKKTFADGDLSKKDLATCNPYNTRSSCVPGLPIGPIASPSLSSLAAVITPDEHDYYYFVADKEKNTYLTKTLREHNDIINKLKREGKWFEY